MRERWRERGLRRLLALAVHGAGGGDRDDGELDIGTRGELQESRVDGGVRGKNLFVVGTEVLLEHREGGEVERAEAVDRVVALEEVLDRADSSGGGGRRLVYKRVYVLCALDVCGYEGGKRVGRWSGGNGECGLLEGRRDDLCSCVMPCACMRGKKDVPLASSSLIVNRSPVPEPEPTNSSCSAAYGTASSNRSRLRWEESAAPACGAERRGGNVGAGWR